MTLLQVAELAAALAGAGKDATGLLDWIQKRREAGHPDNRALNADQRAKVYTHIVTASGSQSEAEKFIQNTLGR